MEIETVYVHKIEGTEVWIPVTARRINETDYVLLDNKEFNNLDETDFLDNFPGDVVTLQERVFANGEVGKVVKDIIYRPAR